MSEPLNLRRTVIAALIAMAIWAVIAVAAQMRLFERFELQGYDLLATARAYPLPPEELVIVDFDNASMQALRASRIPRGVLAEALEKISAGQPELIGLDILLSEKRTPAEDRKLADVLAATRNVVLVESFPGPYVPGELPLPEFRDQGLSVGFANVPLDKDGILRRMWLVARTPEYEGVSFAAQLATQYKRRPLRPGPHGTILWGNTEIPLDDSGDKAALIGFWNPQPARTLPAWNVLRPDFDPALFRGKIVMVGESSAMGKDLYATPVMRKPGEGRAMLSGTEFHATALVALLTGKTIRVMSTTNTWIVNFIAIWLTTVLLITLRPAYGVPAVAAILVATYGLAQFLFSSQQVWLRFVSTAAGALLAVPASLAYRYLDERRLKARAQAERRELMGLFGRYVSPEVAAKIWKRRDEIVLAGEERVATVLFSDIRSFTALTEGKPSSKVLTWLNDYFTAMSDVIQAHGGFLNKFIGDGMLVLFGVPLSAGEREDACRAVRAARQMVERVETLNSQSNQDRPTLKIGIGLHTGPLTAGNVGARDRLEYSVIGETVNLASRLEALTKDYSTSIVMSAATWELVREQVRTEALGEAQIRGFPGKVAIYTLPRDKSPGVAR